MVESVNHMIYQAASEKEADACAWVFTSAQNFERYYYKLPTLDPKEVRARILYTSLCQSDVHTGRGHWGQCIYPCCTGHEVVSEVTAVGSEVTRFKCGDKVCWGPIRDSCGKCEWCLKGWTHTCVEIDSNEKFLYGLYFGGYSTHIQQPESHCYKCPENLKLETLPPLLCAGITTFLPLDLYAKKGMKIGVLGIGGLGHLAAQFASKMELEVHAFSTSEGKEEFYKKLGIVKTVNWKKEKLSNYKYQYDLILNTLPVMINEQEISDLLNCLKPYGKFINVGLADISQKLILGQFSLVENNLSIIGSLVGGVHHTQKMLDFCEKNNVECLCEHYKWEDFPKALEKLEHGKPLFRCVVNVDEFSKGFPNK